MRYWMVFSNLCKAGEQRLPDEVGILFIVDDHHDDFRSTFLIVMKRSFPM